MKRIAAITMVRNDQFFLHKWVEYYGKELGRENLFVYFDGKDQIIPDFCNGINTHVVDKIGQTVVSSDKGRIKFISEKASALFSSGYDIVIGGDADEYLVVDPRTGKSLPEFLSDTKIDVCVSGLGLDFGQRLGEEADLTLDRPFLSQRRFAQIGTRYTKASVICRPCRWGSGFHRVKGHNFHICPDLFMMHFGYSDLRMIENRLSDSDRLSQGWARHMKKRSRTIRYATNLPAYDFDKTTRYARICETIVRKPYAWNKPGLLGLKLIVELPGRFRSVL